VRSPSQIREAIARARAELEAHLSDLKNPQVFSGGDAPGDETMPSQAKPKRSATKGEKTAVKAESATKRKPKSSGSKSKAGRPSRRAKGVAAAAGHVLDTMTAGAVAGAVKAAAQSITENEAKSLKSGRKSSPATGEVLGGMAPDAAVGAIVGAAQAVMPDGAKKEKTKGSSPKKAKGKSPRKN